MSIVIDANMIAFANRLNISSSRMVEDYGLKTIDEIIEAEAAQGNTQAVNYANEMYNSPEKLINIFRLTDVENKFVLLQAMDEQSRIEILPMLEEEDLVMGLYFFNKDKLLEMLQDVDIEEIVNVALDAFPVEDLINLIPEEELAKFFQSNELDKYVIANEFKNLPNEMMTLFLEGLTGMSYDKIEDPEGIINNIISLPEDKFKDFISEIDPDIQRQLVYQITKKNEEYFQLFDQNMYIDMLGTLMKNDMVPSMIKLEKESLVNMISILPDDLMSVVAAQIDTKEFTKYLMDGHLELLQNAWMI